MLKKNGGFLLGWVCMAVYSVFKEFSIELNYIKSYAE